MASSPWAVLRRPSWPPSAPRSSAGKLSSLAPASSSNSATRIAFLRNHLALRSARSARLEGWATRRPSGPPFETHRYAMLLRVRWYGLAASDSALARPESPPLPLRRDALHVRYRRLRGLVEAADRHRRRPVRVAPTAAPRPPQVGARRKPAEAATSPGPPP